MPQRAASEPITISDKRVAEIDALARATDRSRDDIIDQAIEQYLKANNWQMNRIQAGIDAAREGRVRDADGVFGGIGEKYGWAR
ncbi:MAG: ribbon-helix-helix protein, CopG family [Salinarimonas sp.]|nr:ribbon-helix-helix protein, CopG family [Salinarimonas sp.]